MKRGNEQRQGLLKPKKAWGLREGVNSRRRGAYSLTSLEGGNLTSSEDSRWMLSTSAGSATLRATVSLFRWTFCFLDVVGSVSSTGLFFSVKGSEAGMTVLCFDKRCPELGYLLPSSTRAPRLQTHHHYKMQRGTFSS